MSITLFLTFDGRTGIEYIVDKQDYLRTMTT